MVVGYTRILLLTGKSVIKMGFIVSRQIGQYLSSESDHSNITITNGILDSHWLKGGLGEIRTIKRQL